MKVRGADVVITYIGVPGRSYRMQYSTRLTAPYGWKEFSPAAVFTETYTFPGGAVADDQTPLTLSQAIAGSHITTLTEVRVGLQLQGTVADYSFAGEMYVSLNRGGTGTGFTAIPEPETYTALTGLALAGFALFRRYRSRL